ncbi:hypothetical protein ABE867_15305 [Enterococcus gallinarum]|uniref:hypothetical protein n=1 Tax=Enterococcus gallinarum TaxID=1353 RepID=UPI003D6C0180
MDLFKVLGGQAENLNEKGWEYVTTIMANSTTKVGAYLLIFFLIFELAKIFETANKNNEGTVVPITMFQEGVNALLAGALVAGAIFILPFINQIVVGAINLIKGTGSYRLFAFASPAVPSVFDGLGKILSWAISFIVGSISSLIIVVVVCMRSFQLYVYTILAPIAFSSFASSEYRSIGIGFLKQYCAISLQGLVILIVLGISNAFSAPHVEGAVAGGFASLVQPIIVMVLVIQSGRIAKSVVGLGG